MHTRLGLDKFRNTSGIGISKQNERERESNMFLLLGFVSLKACVFEFLSQFIHLVQTFRSRGGGEQRRQPMRCFWRDNMRR